MIPDNPAIIGRDLQRRMASVFPELSDYEIETIWSGRIGITVSRIPQFGDLSADCHFVQGFSGHGVALSGMAGKILAQNAMGDGTAFETLSKLAISPSPAAPCAPRPCPWHGLLQMRDRLKI